MSEINFEIKFNPHGGQQEVRDDILDKQPKVVVVCASRGWGKSLYTTADIVIPYLASAERLQAMWVAPTYKIGRSPIDDVWFGTDDETGERFVTEICPNTGFRFWEFKKADNEIHMWNGSKLYIRSATNPDSIVSKGFGLIVIDEAALIDHEVFTKQILPTARRKGCMIFLISTPRGKNWFYHLFLDGQDPSKPTYASYQQPWWKRPDYPELLVELMKTVPEHIRKQEFEAEFIDDGGGTFTNFDEVFQGESIEFPTDDQFWVHPDLEKIVTEEGAVVSADLAKTHDYTVIVILSARTKQILYYQRFNKEDYKVTISRMYRAREKGQHCDIIYDATGVGVGIGDFLEKDGYNPHPFIFTNQSKADIVQRLMLAFEYGKIKMPNILTIRQEFEIFEYQITRTGKITYSAPDGKHDDIVAAIAMANYYVEEYGSQDIQEINNFLDTIQAVRGGGSFYDFIENDDY